MHRWGLRRAALMRLLSLETFRQWSSKVLLVLLVMSLLAAAAAKGFPQVVTVFLTGSIWALLASGLSLIFSVMNVASFTHGDLFMVGAFTSYFVFQALTRYIPAHTSKLWESLAPFGGILAAMLVGCILGVVLEKMVFSPLRRRGGAGWVMNTFVVTVGVSFLLINTAQLLFGAEYRGIPRYWNVPPILFMGTRIPVERLVSSGLAIGALLLLWAFLMRTSTGRAIRAVAQDAIGAELMGVDPRRIYSISIGLATAMAAMAGGSLLFLFPAYPTMGLVPLYYSWFVVMLAGLGNVAGAIAGGFIVAGIQSFAVTYVGLAWIDLIAVTLMTLVLLLAPSGLFGSPVKGVFER